MNTMPSNANPHVEAVHISAFDAEVERIAAMTGAEIESNLRQVGIEPARTLPVRLYKLLDKECRNAMKTNGDFVEELPACEKTRLPSAPTSFVSLFFQLGERLGPSVAIFLLSIGITILSLFLIVPVLTDRGSEVKVLPIPIEGSASATSTPREGQARATPSPAVQQGIATPTPTAEQAGAAPTPTAEPGSAVPVPTAEQGSAMPTPTAEQASVAPTPTVREIIAAPTPTAEPPDEIVPLTGGATRTWVSGVGDDANPCSRTAPCKTYTGAITKTSAGGEISALDPGGFGAVTITKSITIDGGSFKSSSGGVIVRLWDTSVGDGRVVIRNLLIEGSPQNSGVGITYSRARSLYVENCLIVGFSKAGIDVSMNNVGNGSLFVNDTTIRNSKTGVRLNVVGGNLSATINDCVLKDQDIGIDIRAGTVTIRNSQITNNTASGVTAGGAGSPVAIVDNCVVKNNGNGVVVASSTATIEITNSRVSRNAIGLSNTVGGTMRNFNNEVFSNNINISGS